MLNVQGNKLKALPAAIGNLSSLQSLILQGLIFFQSHHPSFPGQLIVSFPWICYFSLTGNDLRSLPPEIGNLKSLRTLNASENSNLPGVPPTLAHVRTLEVSILTLIKVLLVRSVAITFASNWRSSVSSCNHFDQLLNIVIFFSFYDSQPYYIVYL